MRLLADECMSRLVVESLREAGHDLAWAAEMAPGDGDKNVLAPSVAQDRILLTEDHDFEGLAFRDLSPAIGIVRVAIGRGLGVERVTARIRHAIDTFGDRGLRGRFTLIEPDRTRQRDLPRVAAER